MTDETGDIAANIDAVKAEIAAAAREAGRDPADVELVAVSKTFGADVIRHALEAGQRVFGENRVQEAEDKWPPLKTDYPDTVLHLIGPLQTNKAKNAVALFDVIETVDRARLVTALAKEAEKQDRHPACFVQVNTGEEEQKAGVLPDEADALVATARQAGLNVVGLMCIPPIDEEPSLHFALLREIAERNGLKRLSMGMSADFPVAVAFGATSVRVGTAVFGQRPTPPTA
jgi:pyridoxal phosphate enzyme (YggS family)